MFPYGNTGRITGHFLTTIDINVKKLYYRIICCHNFHCCCRQGCSHFLGEGIGGGGGWGGGQDPQLFYSPPHFGQRLTWGIGSTHLSWMFFCFLWKVDFFKISLPTIHQIERFEVQNSENFLEGSPSPLPKPIPRSFSYFFLNSPTNRTL